MSVSEEKSGGAGHTFNVLFVGLICFRVDDGEAVLPDARDPDDPEIPPHTPFLVVEPKDVKSSSGWDATNSDPAKGVYTFGPCTLNITKATTGGPPTGTHDADVYKLRHADNSFVFGSSAQIITRIHLGDGHLELLKSPSDNANVSRLRVQHDGDVTVTIAEHSGTNRVLVLEPRAKFAIANLPLSISAAQTGDSSKLFKKIAETGMFNPTQMIKRPGMPAVGESYQIFKIGLPSISPLGGCCPPP